MSKLILVSGSTSDLAQNTILKLNKSKVRFVLLYRNKSKLKNLLNELVDPILIKINDKNTSTYSNLEKTLLAKNLQINSFLYFDGIHSFEPLRNISDSNLNESFNVNVFNFVRIMKLITKNNLSKSLYSSVVVSSVASLKINKGVSVYGASKSSLNQFVRSFALELSPRNIRVNSIILGHINTGMGKKTTQFLNKDQMKNLENQHPLGFGHPNDLYNAISFLIDKNKSKWITGTNLVVDGGYLI